MQSPSKYPFSEVENKWRRIGGGKGPSDASMPSEERARRKHYVFPWPTPCGISSGSAVDLGTCRQLVLADTWARFQRHRGQATWFPLALDGFAPHAAGGAAEEGTSTGDGGSAASRVTADMDRLSRLREVLGLDTSAPPVLTSEPSYYRVTQWIFLELMARGLVYRAKRTADSCRRCDRLFRRGIHGSCPRCRGDLTTREVAEWRVDISSYGDRLLGDLDGPDRRVDPQGRSRGGWHPRERILQREYLGRVRGCEVSFAVGRSFELEYHELEVFTTRVEMLFGATFILVDPHHPILDHALDPAYEDDVIRYRERLKKGAEPRISAARTGGFALNPLTLKRIPILVSVLADVPLGRGAVLGIPAHDADQFELAKRMKLPIREVIHNDKAKIDYQLRLEQPWLGDGVLTNSGPFSGLTRKVARDRIITALSRKSCCRKSTRFRVSSFPVSAVAAIGPPVPLLHCERCGVVPVPESELPLELPEKAGGGGRNASRSVCPRCGKGPAVRDEERILPWLGNAWSFVRLALPHLSGRLEGFRDASSPRGEGGAAAPGSASGGGEGALLPGGPQAEGAGAEGGAVTGAPPSGGESPESAASVDAAPPGEVLPEDVDIFSVPLRPREDDGYDEESFRALEGVPGGVGPVAPLEGTGSGDASTGVAGGSVEGAGIEGGTGAGADLDRGPLAAGMPSDRADGLGPAEGGPAAEAQHPRDAGSSGPPESLSSGGAVPEVGAARGAQGEEEGSSGPATAEPPRQGVRHDEDRTPGEGRRGGRDRRGDAEQKGDDRSGGRRPGPKPQEGAGVSPEVPEEEEEVEEERPVQQSRLKPFDSPLLRLLPADVAFGGPCTSVRDILLLRFLAKFLHDVGHVPSHLPFHRFYWVSPVSCPRAEAAQDAKRPGPDVGPRRDPERAGAAKPRAVAPERGRGAADASSSEPVVVPTCVEVAERWGADALRLCLLFAGPVDHPLVLDSRAVKRMAAFLDRIWRQMVLRRERGKFVSRRMLEEKHRLIYEVTRRLSIGKFHTAVAALMSFVDFLERPDTAPEDMDRTAMVTFITLLSPFAPFLARELWSLVGEPADFHSSSWPVASDELIHPPERDFPIFVDGKLRDRMHQPSDLEPEKLESRALQRDKIREIVGNRKVQRVVVVPRRLVSIQMAPVAPPTAPTA